MIWKTIAILLVMVCSNAVYAGPLCFLVSPSYNPAFDTAPTAIANGQMSRVQNVLCGAFRCPNTLLLQNSSTHNAYASFDQSGFAVRYNPQFMNSVRGQFGDLATIGIFAHELGHIIDFASNPNPQIPQAQREATADQYAGCAFALAGEPESGLTGLAATLQAMGASGFATPAQRITLLRQGYASCSN